jgi:hypothetical protein
MLIFIFFSSFGNMASYSVPSTTIHLSNPNTKNIRQKYLLFLIPETWVYRNTTEHSYPIYSLSYLPRSLLRQIQFQKIHNAISILSPRAWQDSNATPNSNSRLSPEESLPMDVEGQITFMERMLKQHIKFLSAGGEDKWKVILVAHSLGSYISLELIRRCRERGKVEERSGMRIIGSICLFPGILHLAKSPNAMAWGVSIYLLDLYSYIQRPHSFLPEIITDTIVITILYSPHSYCISAC